MASIAEFLIYLAENQAELGRFRSDPDTVIESWQRLVKSELTAEQKALLKIGELTDVRARVEAEFDVPGEPRPLKIVWGIVWFLSEPDQGNGS